MKLSLIKQLDTIYNEDQTSRQQLMLLINKQGVASHSVKSLWHVIEKADSINLKKVKTILEKYGWLGADVVGSKGNSALFLVIQHADKQTRTLYIPMMRAALKEKNASAADLALLEDRLALEQGKKQIYESQLGFNEKIKRYYVLPLENPDQVDVRRKEVGLKPMKEHLSA